MLSLAAEAQRSALPNHVFGIASDKSMNPHSKLIYRVGDMVRIKSGPFANFPGRVDGINQSKSLLKVAVEIFGRVTPVKVNFSEAEKLPFERPLPPQSTQN
jgi:transcription antitermination factor NusG